MSSFIPDQLIWWVTAVDVPLISAFLIAFARLKRDVEHEIERARDHLSAFKLEVAQSYASINHVKDLEARLIAHLLRIETKLDNTALKAHAVYVSPAHKEI